MAAPLSRGSSTEANVFRGRPDGRSTHHAYWCVVDGGTYRHRFNGFWCPRCAEQQGGPARRLESILSAIDKRVGGV